jgi:ribosomal-protein-alanine N-acetyltransferase
MSMPSYATSWRLRRARLSDVDGLHALAVKPLVYRYLFDGAAPDRDYVSARVTQSVARSRESGFGMWLLDGPSAGCAGCAELRPYPLPDAAEVTYLLDPAHWGRGLAARMVWTVITGAFDASRIDTVIAGADVPNAASLALMRRLGMRFHKEVRYPLGAGLEYVLRRGDAGPVQTLAPLPID